MMREGNPISGVTIPVVKPHGQIRCGTNYLTSVMRKNLAVTVYESEEGGWKHGPIKGDPAVFYILLTKDPYSWLVSFKSWEEIHRRSRPMSMAAFLMEPVSHPKLRLTWSAIDPLDAWNRSYFSWLAQHDGRDLMVLAFESLLTDLQGRLEAVERHIGAQRLQQVFSDVAERVDTWATPRRRPPLDLARYLDGAALSEFDDRALGIVRERIDAELVLQLGYEVL